MATVANLAEYRNRDTSELLTYLNARLLAGDLQGLVIQSLDRRGKERTHITGAYKEDPARAASAAMSMSVRMTMASREREA